MDGDAWALHLGIGEILINVLGGGVQRAHCIICGLEGFGVERNAGVLFKQGIGFREVRTPLIIVVILAAKLDSSLVHRSRLWLIHILRIEVLLASRDKLCFSNWHWGWRHYCMATGNDLFLYGPRLRTKYR